MPYAVPTHSPTSTAATSPTSTSPTSSPITTTRANLRRSRSSFTDEQGPGAFVAMGALPKRRPTTKKAFFHLNAEDDSPQELEDNNPPVSEIPPFMRSTVHDNGRNSSPPSLKLSMAVGRFSPPTYIELPAMQTPVPFPTSSPLPSPSYSMPARSPPAFGSYSPPRASSIPRTPSTPIILSNGKPLKSSLKSSLSSPDIPDLQRTKHLRAQSAPSTPNLHKNVHFAEKDCGLETVKVFNRTGKPANLSKASGDETETETEAENNPSNSGLGGYPFPSLSPASFAGSSVSSVASTSQTASKPIIHEIDPSPSSTSDVPHSSPSPHANVHLETVTLPRTRPPTLRGTVIVRNVAYEKNVAVRFTLDDWQTTSEVTCKHVVSLPGLPPPFPRASRNGGDGVDGDVATRVVAGEEEGIRSLAWDRFSFTIRLEDYESKLSDRTLFLVTRFSSPVGEWWDNNNGQNYRVGFRRAVVSPLVSPLNTPSGTPTASAMSSPFMSTVSLSNSAHFLTSMNATAGSPSGLAQQRTFSAPSALRYTPMTGALAGVPVISAQNGLALGGRSGTPPLCRSMSSPYPGGSPTRQPSPLIATSGSPTRSYSAPSPGANQKALPTGKDAQGRPHTLPKVHMPNSPPSPSATQTSSYIKRRLSLSNYVAPGSGPSPTAVVKPAVSAPAPSPSPPPSGSEGLVTPPNTPPSTVRARSSSLPSEFEGVPNLVEEQSTVAHGSGDVAVEKPSPTVTIIGGMSAASVDPDLPSGSESPFSPTRTTMPFVNFEGLGLSGIGGYGTGLGGGLMSPPRSRDTSEDGGSGEGGRSSPTLPILDFKAPGALKVVPSYVSSAPQDSSSPAGSTPSLTSTPSAAGSAGSAVLRSPVVATLSTLGYGGPDSGRVDTNDSSYAAFVRQWCFAQSTPPTPGVEHSPDASDDPTPKGSPPAAYSPPGGILGVGRKWNNAGYSFPGFNFGVGVSPDAGMVGGESQI